MATNRDWQLGNIELPSGSDQALGVWATGDSEPAFKVLASGAVTAASVTADSITAPVSFLSLGAATTPAIADGVLTVTSSHVNPAPEDGTSDTVDSIVKAGATAGDLLLIHVPATNTITFDDAEINLGDATRAVAPGGSLLLVYDGTQWSEVSFTASTDNA